MPRQEMFRGRYILVQPDTCISVIRRGGLRSVGSIMKCLTWPGSSINSNCNIPRESTRMSDEIGKNIVDALNQELNSGDETPNEFDTGSPEKYSENVNIITK
ncbi:unnamed protein product [Schistosoma margrebowiei]|uniref:Uncharacterized protein n=1 Tax=Schistosoma margrebowiei TaxID=48269 RepID=A0A183N9E4_9TREM|nr:unnamed protein product [Schistosoma margrebowiei]